MDLSTVITRSFTITSRGLWRLVIARAACSAGDLNPDDWYPVSVPVAAARREAAGAIAVCAGCAVREPCLELSLRHWAVGRYGVWGGTVPGERKELRARLSQALGRSPDTDWVAS